MALHEHRAQVHAQFLDGRQAEEPVAVVDLVDGDQSGAHTMVCGTIWLCGVGVFGDIQVALDDAAGGRPGRAIQRSPGAVVVVGYSKPQEIAMLKSLSAGLLGLGFMSI